MNTLTKILCFIFFLWIGLSIEVNAQKEQVAFTQGVFEIRKDLIPQLPVLTPYSDGFKTSQLFRDEMGLYTIKIQYEKRGNEWSEEYPFSKEQLDQLREQLENTSLNRYSEKKEKSGRAYLITSVTLHSIPQGALLGATMRRTSFDPWFGTPYTEPTPLGRALPLIAAAGSFTSSLLLTKNKEIPLSAANMHFFGSLMGYGHGALIGALVTGENGTSNTYRLLTSGMSIAEGWALYYVAKKHKFDYDRSVAWNSGNFWGTVQGSLLPIAIQGSRLQPRFLGATGLIGGVGGTVLFDYLHKKSPRSAGDYRAINTLGYVGAVWVPAIFPDLDRGTDVAVSFMSATALALGAGHLLTRETNFSKVEGGLVVLGTWVGGLLGAGTGILIDSENYATSLRITSFGATLGWAISYLYFKNNRLDGGLFGLNSRKKSRSHFDFQFNPVALGAMRSSPEQQSAMLVQGRGLDMVSCRLAF